MVDYAEDGLEKQFIGTVTITISRGKHHFGAMRAVRSRQLLVVAVSNYS